MMITSRCLIPVWVCLLLALLPRGSCRAAESSPKQSTPKASIRASAEYILRCQIPGGLISLTADEQIRGVPYFANQACLGLVRAYQVTRDRRYLDAVLRYADWYIQHMNADGTIYDYLGTRSNPTPTSDYDASDAYPATFITLCYETYRVTHDRAWLKVRYPAMVRSVDGILLTWQSDGLTYGKPNYKVKYLMDNIEVRFGLQAATLIATTLRDGPREQRWRDLVERNLQGLRKFWLADEGRFAVGIFEDGSLHRPFLEWYPDGMANAFALGYLLSPSDPKAKALFGSVDRRFPDASDFWWFAAKRLFSPRDVDRALGKYTESFLNSNHGSPYSFEHGLHIRALAAAKETFLYGGERLLLPDLRPSSPRKGHGAVRNAQH